jgi:outer membrane protein OmpA-like peptidoglycan-associated protein
MARSVSAGIVLAATLAVPVTSAAQGRIPSHVRVVNKSERILRWLGPQMDVILVVDQGTTLEVLDFDRDESSYWVILPPDLHGTRKVGWSRASAVEPHVAAATTESATGVYIAPPDVPIDPQRGGAQTETRAAPSTNAPAAEEKVTISVRRDDRAGGTAAAAPRSYAFEDVHFDRDASSLRNEEVETLRLAAAALKADPSLVVTLEGHTCSLGSATYNQALGSRRASAVKAYLVDAGVPADRLLTVSQGEAHAEYDNSREETRRLNRRVALVAKTPR